jgi:hypothetical protein
MEAGGVGCKTWGRSVSGRTVWRFTWIYAPHWAGQDGQDGLDELSLIDVV